MRNAKIVCLAVVSIVAIASAACSSSTSSQSAPAIERATPVPINMPATAHPSCSADALAQAVPDRYDGYGFDRYYELVLDDQVVMRYVFQPSLTQAQIEHVVRTTRWYLTDVPSARYGSDKSAVLATLAEREATMVIPDGSHVEGRDLGVRGQELYANEIAAPGSVWYVDNDGEHRDATLEEVFHQVHDEGIGTNEPGALPQYQAALLAEAELAKDDGRWATGADDWIADLSQEGSLAQEYIASVIDNYYGLWAHETGGSGYYSANTRASVIANDPAGYELLTQFLGDVVEVEAYIDPGFTGTFSLNAEDGAPYSGKSQHLRGARLTGSNPAGIAGNALDNTLRGNDSDNHLDGRDGNDMAIYCAASTEYDVAAEGGEITVTGPDGTDTLVNIETLYFADGPQDVAA